MKLEWDELWMLSDFVKANFEGFRTHIEGFGFEPPTAESILSRFLLMTQEEERAYVERFGHNRKPSMAQATMQVTKRTKGPDGEASEQVFDIKLEYNKTDGWYVARVPGKIAFVLLATTLDSAKQRLHNRGWSWKIIDGTNPDLPQP